MPDLKQAFAETSVATAPSPAASGTSMVVSADFPLGGIAAPFNIIVAPPNTRAISSNAEICRVTAKAGTTWTITRAQEGTTARSILVGDIVYLAISPKSFTDIEPTGSLFGDVITPAQITANTDNYNPTGLATASHIRASTDATRSLTGIVAPAQGGRTLLLSNIGSQQLNLVHDSTSTAANRFYLGGGVAAGTAFTVYPNAQVMLVYDITSARWRVHLHTQAGGSLPLGLGTPAVGTSGYWSHEDHVHPATLDDAITMSGVITPTQLVANTDNWAPTNFALASTIRASTSAAFNITGLTAGIEGRVIYLRNVGAFIISLIHDLTSTAANRFFVGNATAGDAFRLFPNQTVELIYDATLARWCVLGVSPVGSATPLVAAVAGSVGASSWAARENHVHPSEIGAPQTYTPQVDQGATTNIAKTLLDSSYVVFGKLVFVRVGVQLTGTGTTANIITITAPVAAHSTTGNMWAGVGLFLDATGPTYYPIAVRFNSTTQFAFRRTDVGTNSSVGIDPSVPFDVNDAITFFAIYEAA